MPSCATEAVCLKLGCVPALSTLLPSRAGRGWGCQVIQHSPCPTLQSSTAVLIYGAQLRGWDSSTCWAPGLPSLASQQESCVSSAMGAGCSWPRMIRMLCVSGFNCNVAHLLEERLMNNKCSSIKSKIRFSSSDILPAISSPLFFPTAFIFKTQGFIFHLQNHRTQACKSGVRW